MKCAIHTAAATVACMQRRMIDMVMGAHQCTDSAGASESPRPCWSTSGSAVRSDVGGSPGTLIDAASADPRFQTLTKAIVDAGLAETLNQKGPLTVFAPTDAAFGKVPPEIMSDLLKPWNKDKLTSVLTLHVVEGGLTADVIESSTIKTVSGEELNLKVTAAKTTIGNANIVETDLTTSNGIIHVIDEVLLPASTD